MFLLAVHLVRFPRQALVVLLTTSVGLLWMLAQRMWSVKAAPEPLLEDRFREYTVRLLHRSAVARNTLLLRFALPRKNQMLGCGVGQHVYLIIRRPGRLLIRPYTPVSLRDHLGTFDVIVKVYRQGSSFSFPAGGIMSQMLDHMRVGETIEVQGPKGKFQYLGRGRFVTDNGRVLCLASHLGLIAAGSGVTPMLQLLRHMFSDPNDVTRILMLNVHHSEQDIIMRQELEAYAAEHRRTFKLCHVLSEMPEFKVKKSPVQYLEGPLTQAIIEEFLPPPSSYCIVLVCGPPRLVSEVCQPALRNIGHERDRVLVY